MLEHRQLLEFWLLLIEMYKTLETVSNCWLVLKPKSSLKLRLGKQCIKRICEVCITCSISEKAFQHHLNTIHNLTEYKASLQIVETDGVTEKLGFLNMAHDSKKVFVLANLYQLSSRALNNSTVIKHSHRNDRAIQVSSACFLKEVCLFALVQPSLSLSCSLAQVLPEALAKRKCKKSDLFHTYFLEHWPKRSARSQMVGVRTSPAPQAQLDLAASFEASHSHGHSHRVFILATYPKGK